MAGAALLIGNTTYREPSLFPSLSTPGNDVSALYDRMEALGFDTYIVTDATRRVMGEVISQFREVVAQLPARANVLVHFAGHGMQKDGDNYLVPVDAQGSNELAVLSSCFRLSEVMHALCWRDDHQKLFTIDACRVHRVPSGARSGVLGLAGESPDRFGDVEETMVFYSTASGKTAADGAEYGFSPFCLGLLDALKTPDLPIYALAAHTTGFVRQLRSEQRPAAYGMLSNLWPFAPGPGDGGMPVTLPMTSSPPDDADRYVSERGHLIHKLKAKDTTGRWAYYFLLVEPDREGEFLLAINGPGTIDLELYGSVIASCYGEEPTPEVREYLKTRYGFEV